MNIMADETLKSALGNFLEVNKISTSEYENVTIIYPAKPGNERRLNDPNEGLNWVLEHAPEGNPIIMLDWVRLDLIRDIRFQAAMGHPNVYYAPQPQSLLAIKRAIEEAGNPTRPRDELAIRLKDIIVSQSDLAVLRHDLRYVQNGQKDMEKWMELARKAYGDLSFEELAQKVENEAKPQVSSFAGKRLEGVFVDVEGTLIQNGQINPDLSVMLEEKAEEKPITIWTDADISEYSSQLCYGGIYWKLLPKEMFVGATAEEVYDDLPQDEFEERYGIKAEIYHQVEPKEDIREGNPQSPGTI